MCRNGILKGEMIKKKSLVFQLIQKEKKPKCQLIKTSLLILETEVPQR